jgi:hypothetical protein
MGDTDGRTARKVEAEPEFRVPAFDRVENLVARCHQAQPDIDARVGFAKFDDGAGMMLAARPLIRASVTEPRRSPFQFFDQRERAVHVAHGFAHVAYDQFACRSQDKAAARPVEKRDAQILFQPQDLAADRGGRDIEAFGSLSDRALADDFVEVAEQAGMEHDRTLRLDCEWSDLSIAHYVRKTMLFLAHRSR